MPAEESKALIRRLFDEVVNEQQLAALDEVVSPTFDCGPDLPRGPEGAKQIVLWLHSVFADLHYSIEDLVAEGEKVAVRLRARGIHEGTYLGHPGTGKAVTYAEFIIFRIGAGQIQEWWLVVDAMSILQQIGALSTSA